jgi:hypothetical protein
MERRISPLGTEGFRRFGFPTAIGLAGLFFLVCAFQTQRIGANLRGDPGPEFLPAAMGLLLMLGGLAVAWSQFRDSHVIASGQSSSNDLVMWSLVGGMLIYLPALSWIGFSVASILGCTALLYMLKTRFLIALAFSVGLVVFAKMVFTRIFEVQLPEGLLENWLS